MITLDLPFPPSTNTYWRHTAIRGKPRTLISAKGRAYRQEVIQLCRMARPPKLVGEIICTLSLYPPDKRRRDCDNYAKAVLDALQHAKVYDDDSQIIDLTIRMLPTQKPKGRLLVDLKCFE